VTALALPSPTRTSGAALDFEALYRAARDDVFAYVATLLRDHAAAEDVTAHAFERAYRKQRSYKPARGSARAWLFGIARNAALDELRRRKRTAALAADPADLESATPEDHAEAALRRAGAARTARARARRPQVPRGSGQRRDRRRPGRERLQRRHPAAPRHDQAPGGRRQCLT
jgi:RNA polymerase sigma factor (sigma-70 family)